MTPYPDRIDRTRQAMADAGIDLLMLSIGPELPYLTGYEAMDTERLTLLVLGLEGVASLVVPRLEAPRVILRDGLFDVVAWTETEDPLRIARSLADGARRVGVGDRTRARFLLGLQARLTNAEFTSASAVLDQLRLRKDAAEVEALRAVGAAVDRVSVRLGELPFEGRRELDVAADIASMLREEGHEEVTFTIVASGPNGASPHHEPAHRTIQSGDAVVLDYGGRRDRYCSDTTRNVVVGSAPSGYGEVHSIVNEAHAAAVAAARPGVPAQDVDRAARKVIDEAGYGEFFVHRTGHGIGLEGHEAPYIVEGNSMILEPGMAFSVEPGVYLPGRFGVRIEDIAVVTDDGVELLNTSPHDHLVV